MDFNLTDVQRAWQARAQAFVRELPRSSDSIAVVALAARTRLVDPHIDLLSAAVAIESVAWESADAAIALALHTGVISGLAEGTHRSSLASGEKVGAIALSSEDVPSYSNGTLSGRTSWVAPLTGRALAIVGVRGGNGLEAAAVSLDSPGVTMEPVSSAGLTRVACGHLRFDHAPFTAAGATMPFMARVRVLLAAAGIGMGRRALHEALAVARGHTGRGAGGEQIGRASCRERGGGAGGAGGVEEK